jgi:hypothetical protein
MTGQEVDEVARISHRIRQTSFRLLRRRGRFIAIEEDSLSKPRRCSKTWHKGMPAWYLTGQFIEQVFRCCVEIDSTVMHAFVCFCRQALRSLVITFAPCACGDRQGGAGSTIFDDMEIKTIDSIMKSS